MKNLIVFLSLLFTINIVKSSLVINTRVIGGRFSQISENPYLVSIRYNNKHRCGGSLIQVNRVLTAAHCLTDYLPGGLFYNNLNKVTVVTGNDNLNSPNGASYQVLSLHPHENFNALLHLNDIGIIKLSTNVVLSAFVQTIPLPTTAFIPIGANLEVAGFGVFQKGNPMLTNHRISTYLRKLEISVIDSAQCQQAWSNRFANVVKINQGHICTGTNNGVGVCSGDSGGPLVYGGRLVGLVSFGYTNCAAGLPDVSTRVGYYLNFINQHLA